MGTVVKFSADPDATTIQSFNVYRAITGVVTAQEPFTVLNKMIVFRVAGDPKFTKFTIESNDPEDIVAQLNKFGGINAITMGASPNRKIIIRTTGELIEFVMTSGLAGLGVGAGVYRPKMNFVQIGSVPFVSGTGSYELADGDGDPADWYHVRDVDTSSTEQAPGVAFQALGSIADTCAIEGVTITGQGEPLKGILVQATPYLVNNQVGKGPVKTYTDDQGRWRLNLVKNVRYYVEIPDTDFGNAYVVPDEDSVKLEDMLVDGSWRNEDTAFPQAAP